MKINFSKRIFLIFLSKIIFAFNINNNFFKNFSAFEYKKEEKFFPRKFLSIYLEIFYPKKKFLETDFLCLILNLYIFLI